MGREARVVSTPVIAAQPMSGVEPRPAVAST